MGHTDVAPPVAAELGILFERNPQPMWLVDQVTLRFLAANEAAVSRYGYTRAEFLAMTACDMRPPEDVPALTRMVQERPRHDGHVSMLGTWRHRKKDGSLIDVEVSLLDLEYEGRPTSLVIAYDVTRRVETERRLALSEQRLQDAQAVAHLGSWEYDGATGEAVCSQELYRMYGVSPDAFTPPGPAFLALVHPDERAEVASRIERSGRDQSLLQFETRIVRPDGALRHILVRGEYIPGPSGAVRMVGVSQDITERKEAERHSTRQRELLQRIFDHIPVMVVLLDAAGRLQLANRAFTSVLGWDLTSLEGRDFMSAAYPDEADRERVLAFIRSATTRWAEFRTMTRDGRVIETAWANVALSDGTFIGIGQDVTERKQAEEERARLLASERVARAEAETALARLRQIHAVTDTALALLGMDELLDETLSRLRTAIGADIANVLLLSESGPWLVVRASQGLGPVRSVGDAVPVARGIAGRAAALRQAVVVSDVSTVDGLRVSLRGQVRSMMAAPLLVEGQVVGVLDVATREAREFSDEDLRFLQLVADRVAPVIDRARVVEKLAAGKRQLSVVSQRLVETQEAERAEIARELHDEVGQLLTGLKLMLETPGATDRRDEMKGIVNDLMARVRGLSMSLRPPMLDDLGLVPALLWLVQHYSGQTGVQVDLSHQGLERRLRADVETAAFRIVQEALTNVARHAEVKAAEVRVEAAPAHVLVQVRDEGCGFDALTRGVGSAGLAGMRERARLVGGRLVVDSRPGQGTIISAVLPLAAPAEPEG